MKIPRQSKYRAQPVTVDGVHYASTGEYRRWCELAALQQAGRICNLARQVRVELIAYGRDHEPARLGAKGRFYVADFAYEIDGQFQLEDFKGCDTALSQLKREMVAAQTGRPVLLTRAVTRRPRGDVASGISPALLRQAARKQAGSKHTGGA
jgi:hypothetical protein